MSAHSAASMTKRGVCSIDLSHLPCNRYIYSKGWSGIFHGSHCPHPLKVITYFLNTKRQGEYNQNSSERQALIINRLKCVRKAREKGSVETK